MIRSLAQFQDDLALNGSCRKPLDQCMGFRKSECRTGHLRCLCRHSPLREASGNGHGEGKPPIRSKTIKPAPQHFMRGWEPMQCEARSQQHRIR